MIKRYIARDAIHLPENTIVIDRSRFNMINPNTTFITSTSGSAIKLSNLNIIYSDNGSENILKLSLDLMMKMGLDSGMDVVQLISVDEKHRPGFDTNKEFFFANLLLGEVKKRYCSKIILREGDGLLKPKYEE